MKNRDDICFMHQGCAHTSFLKQITTIANKNVFINVSSFVFLLFIHFPNLTFSKSMYFTPAYLVTSRIHQACRALAQHLSDVPHVVGRSTQGTHL